MERAKRYFTGQYVDGQRPDGERGWTNNVYLRTLSEESQRAFHSLVYHMEGEMLDDGEYYQGSGEDLVAHAILRAGHAILEERDRLQDVPALGSDEEPLVHLETAFDEIIARGRDKQGASLGLTDQTLFGHTQLFGALEIRYFQYDLDGKFNPTDTLSMMRAETPIGQEVSPFSLAMLDVAKRLSRAISVLSVPNPVKPVMPGATPG